MVGPGECLNKLAIVQDIIFLSVTYGILNSTNHEIKQIMLSHNPLKESTTIDLVVYCHLVKT